MRAASLKTFRRCSPSVVPMLPPTGVAGAGSLNPCPAGSVTTTTRFAPEAGATARTRRSERRNEMRRIA